MNAPTKNPRRGLATGSIRIAVSGILLYLVLHWVPIDGIAISLWSVDLRWVLLAYALTVLVVLLSVQQLHLLLNTANTPIRFSQLLHIHLTTEFWGLIMPGYLSSGVMRFYRMSRAGSPAMRTLAVVVFRRLIEATAVVLLGWVFWSIAPLPGRSANLFQWGFAGASLTLLALHFFVFDARTSAWLRKRLQSNDTEQEPGRIRRKLIELPDATALLAKIPSKSLLLFIAIVTVRNLASVVIFYAMVMSLNLPLSFADAGLAWAVVRLATMLPVTVAGLGLREVSLLLVLSSSEVPAASVVALAFLLLSRDLLIRFAGGLLEAWSWCATPSSRSAAKTD